MLTDSGVPDRGECYRDFRRATDHAPAPRMISAFTFFSRLNCSTHSVSVNSLTFVACTVRSSQSVASPPKK